VDLDCSIGGASVEFLNCYDDALRDQVIELYGSVGWSAYTADTDALVRALKNSTYVFLCCLDSKIVGLIRGVSDDVSINYIQDILVHPEYQRRGIGHALMKHCLEKYSHGGNSSLLTENTDQQICFYKSFGFRNPKELKRYRINSFIKMKHVDLE
jgi:ribosomal protein S18 acetylase RimI-like enzyme